MAKSKELQKTNAMRRVQDSGYPHVLRSYDVADDAIDGLSVAAKLGLPPEQVYKTLVTRGGSGEHYVFVIPVAAELDKKAAARAVGEKAVDMVHVREIQKLTGYVRGGCSPIGMKKPFVTVIDEACILQERIVVSGGRIGSQIEMAPEDLARLVGARVETVTRQV